MPVEPACFYFIFFCTSDMSSPGRSRVVVVCGCGRVFLAMLSLLQIRMALLADEGDGSTGVQSASLDGASMVTLALILGSLFLVLEPCKV